MLKIQDKYKKRDVMHSDNKLAINYILICGSYNENSFNDALCKSIGFNLSKLGIGIISGSNKPGLVISSSLCKFLDDENKYEADKIIFYLRRKEKPSKVLAEQIHVGTVKFFGKHPIELRQRMISEVSAVILIGGKEGTFEEEQLAVINNVPVIPIACSGGTANIIWEKYKTNSDDLKSRKYFNSTSFEALKSNNLNIVVDSVISILDKILKT